MGVRRLNFGFLLPAAIGSLVLVACQSDGPPVVSLAEAKKVTARFTTPAFVPPPRTISDVVARLDELASVKSDRETKLRAQADALPPPNQSTEDAARFYLQRGNAARFLGRHRQGVEDVMKALELIPDDAKSLVLNTLAAIHEELGDYEVAAEYAAKSAEAAIESGAVIRSNVVLTAMLTNIGDLEGGEIAISKANSRVSDTVGWRGDSRAWVPFMRYLVSLGNGQLKYSQGIYSEAERTIRATLKAIEEDIANGSDGRSIVGAAGISLSTIRITLKSYALRVLGQILMRQGRLAESEVVARDALFTQARNFGRNSGQTVEGMGGLTEILREQGRFKEATNLAKVTLDVYAKMGADENSVTLAAARRSLADTYVGQSRWADAMAIYDRIANDLARDTDSLRRLFGGNLTWALALIRSHRDDEAVERLRAIHRRLDRNLGPGQYATAEAQGLLGSALGAGGNDVAASEAFSTALPTLLSQLNRSDTEDTTESGRQLRLQFILESYLRVLAQRARTGAGTTRVTAAREAFRIANAARGGTVKRALGYSAARAAAKDPDLADLARREQDALQRIGALNGLLVRAGAERQGLLDRIALLKASRKAIKSEISARFPAYARLIDPKPATVDQARASLAPGEALIATYVSEDHTYVWAVPETGEVVFNVVALGREDLTDDVALLRAALDPSAATLGDIPPFDVAVAHRLFKTLLEPVQDGWKDAKSLAVVAHGPLGYLPLALLPTRPATVVEVEPLFSAYRAMPWLIRSHAITVLPSVASLATLRALPPGDESRKAFAGFGDPYFSREQAAEALRSEGKLDKSAAMSNRERRTPGRPLRLRAAPRTAGLESAGLAQLPRLVDTADEIHGIALALKADLTDDVFLGGRANEGTVKALNLSGYKVIAFATHGLVPGDLNGLTQPALALSAPAVAGTEGDGLLTMGEILSLKLDADWVVLSACNTGAGQGAGAEAVSGLGRAFFYAGTRALLVSNWPVETTSARALTTDLFRRQAADPTVGRAQALRQAMLALIDGRGYVDAEGKTVFSYAHPLFWAPFSLIGDGGGGARSS
jgi:CHAT domain-containing protein